MKCYVNFLLIVLLFTLTTDSAQSQVRKKRTGVTTSDFATQHFIGPIVQFNNVSGIEWEMTMKNKSGGSSKSTFSLIGGYASRLGKVDFIKPINLNNETVEIRAKKTEWVNGVGGAIVLNNYIENFKEGPYWSVGASGNYYFKKGVGSSYVDSVRQNDNTYKTVEVNYPTTNLKTFSVFALVGYKYLLGDRYAIKPQLGAGIMGSPFRSSSSSGINGFFVNIGCSVLFKRK